MLHSNSDHSCIIHWVRLHMWATPRRHGVDLLVTLSEEGSSPKCIMDVIAGWIQH